MEQIDGDIVNETDKAYLFLPDGWEEADAVWLPKSKVEWDDKKKEMEVPIWLIRLHKLDL